jgi:DNA-binding NtrC family response regulator
MLVMNKNPALISFVGMHDPYPQDDEEPGPILSLLLEAEKECPFSEVWLFCTSGTFFERARDLEREAKDEGLGARFHLIDFQVKDVIDYAEIWALLSLRLASIKAQAEDSERGWVFLLDSGTPQMKTALLLASRSGLFPATLVQGIPARFAGGAYKSRTVRLDGLPEMEIASHIAVVREGEGTYGIPGTGVTRPEGDTRSETLPIATSALFAELLRRAEAAARFGEPVLLLGETGTGKTMVARRIHAMSARRDSPFIEVNCSAISSGLAESELFGHERGAFTGADKARSGKFRAAQGGTLFLDELGDLPLEIQAKLLKAIEDKEVTPVGADRPLAVDVRLIAATNRDLSELVRSGRFRADLYERLKVVVLRLPPLRERREDIRPLALRFLDDWNELYSEGRFLTEDALELLEAYSWPGNVRELGNALRSAACSFASKAIGPECFPEELKSSLPRTERWASSELFPRDESLPVEGFSLKAYLLQVEWKYVSEALRRTGNNAESAAKLLGMTGHAFRKALRERFSAFMEGEREGEL